MGLPPGTRLGPYEILAPIGAGGMGQVYKARDSRLDRSVAIKILSAEFAAEEKGRVSSFQALQDAATTSPSAAARDELHACSARS